MKTHQDLIQEIDQAQPGPNSAQFWWIGQMGFVVKIGQRVLYFDPFLQPRPTRLVPPLLDPAEVRHADFIFGSHAHGDHIDKTSVPGLAAASPRARFVCSRVASSLVSSLGVPVDRIVALDEDLVYEEDGLKISAIAAQHETFDRDNALGYPYLCFIVECGGLTLLHMGDTLRYEGMLAKLSRWQFDLMFLPINGRDAERLARRCYGNMTFQEAVDLAGELRPRLTIPGHYDMFANNAEDPQKFCRYMDVKYPGLCYWVGLHGTAVVYSR